MAGNVPVPLPRPRPTTQDGAALQGASKELASEDCAIEKDSTAATKQCKPKVAIVITVTRKTTDADAHATLGDLDVRREGDAAAVITGATVEQPRGTRDLGKGAGSKEYPIPAGTYNAHVKPWTSKNGNLTGEAKKKAVRLENVPNYEEILIHVGNNPWDTEGCILANASASAIPVKDPKTGKVTSYQGKGSGSKGINQEILDFIFKVRDEENDGEEPKITVIVKDP